MKEIEIIKEIIERHKQEIAEKYHISEIGVFGSYIPHIGSVILQETQYV